MTTGGIGHNEAAVRLAALAGDAQFALDRVARGEVEAIEGWLAYGAALNEGRALFPSDEQFGRWKAESVLGKLPITPEAKEDQAAMWAAANRDQFEEARAAGKARTVRGIHTKWKEIEAAREKEAREAEKRADMERKKAEADAARKKADEQARVAKEAAEAAKTAKDENERIEAEVKAAEAAAAKDDAEQAAEQAEAAVADVDAAQDESPEATALRKEFRKLTPEAQEDDFVGLHMSLREKEAEIVSLKEEIAKRDTWWNAADGGKNKNRSFAMADAQVRAAEGRMKEYQATAARLQRQVNAQQAEIKRLKAEIENTMIPLN